jgi:hypothetical protein
LKLANGLKRERERERERTYRERKREKLCCNVIEEIKKLLI